MTGPRPTSAALPRNVASAALCAPSSRPWLLAAAVLASALGFIDGSVVAIAMPAMRASLGATLPQAQWIGNAYLLALSPLILAGGALGDRFGLVRVFAIGIAAFVAASLVCAIVRDPPGMIAARGLQGIGAALMIPGSLALVARAYPAAERGRAIGIWASASAVTTALGPLLGGGLLSLGGPDAWRWIFAVNLPLGGLALWMLLAKAEREAPTRPVPLDLGGILAASLGLGLLAFAFTGASEGGGAPPGTVLPIAVAGALCLAVFLAIEARSGHAMMPLGLFRDRVFAAANLLTFLLYAALSAILFFLPMTLIAGWGLNAFRAGLAFLPLTIAVASLSGPAGAWADRAGPRRPILAGTLLVTAAYAALALATPHMAFWWGVIPCMAAAGIGMGLVVAPLSSAVMGSVPDTSGGVASGVNNALSRIAGLIAIAALGTLVGHWYLAAGGPASFGEAAPGASGHEPAMNAAFQRLAWCASGLAGAAAAVTALAMPQGRKTAR